jgi:glutamate racemase
MGARGERPSWGCRSVTLEQFSGWENEGRKFGSKPSRRVCTIGVFDSGIGGLTCYRTLRRAFPHVNIIYFADMARQPYGPRNQSEVAEFSAEIMRFLRREGAGLAVVACNTATAATFDNRVNLREEFSAFPVLGTIPDAARAALAAALAAAKRRAISEGRLKEWLQFPPPLHIGVVATEGTCRSGAYQRALTAFATGLSMHQAPVACLVTQMPAPAFMRIAERGDVTSQRTLRLTRQYLEPCRVGGRALTLEPACALRGLPLPTGEGSDDDVRSIDSEHKEDSAKDADGEQSHGPESNDECARRVEIWKQSGWNTLNAGAGPRILAPASTDAPRMVASVHRARTQPIDAVIYGCTHYPLLKSAIERVLFHEWGRPDVAMIDPAEALVDALRPLIVPRPDMDRLLSALGAVEEVTPSPRDSMDDVPEDAGWTRFCVNANVSGFAKRASRVLGRDVRTLCELVDLSPPPVHRYCF